MCKPVLKVVRCFTTARIGRYAARRKPTTTTVVLPRSLHPQPSTSTTTPYWGASQNLIHYVTMAAAVDPAAALAALRAQANSLLAPLAMPDECLKEWVLFAGTMVPTFVMAPEGLVEDDEVVEVEEVSHYSLFRWGFTRAKLTPAPLPLSLYCGEQ